MIDREVIENTIGKTFADKLDEVIIHVSQDISYTRREMVESLGCANFIAASRLNKILKKLQIFTAAKLYHTDPYALVSARGIGETSMFVAMCILEKHNYDAEKWWGWKGTNGVKFSTYKHNATRKASRRKHVV